MLSVAEYVGKFLQAQGITCVFELIGGMTTFLIDSFHQTTQLKIVSMHHEQGAAFAAEGYARMTGLPGVALATSGPGATNLLTGVASCYFDSSPALFITGQVNRHELKGERAIRQLGFQETDVVTMAKPITKGAWLVTEPTEFPALLERAYGVATGGRCGPVVVDIPMDVQRVSIDAAPEPLKRAAARAAGPAITEAISRLLNSLSRAQRPLLLAGGGLRVAGAADTFRSLVQTLQVPVVHSLMGVDALPSSSPYRVGMIGSYGNRWANVALHESDLVVVLGSRLDVRQTGPNTQAFKQNKTVWHVDCEPGEMNNRITGCEVIEAQLGDFCTAALASAREAARAEWGPWVAHLAALARKWPDTAECDAKGGINPNVLMHAISAASARACAYVVDVGQHQMWAAQSLAMAEHQRFLTSGGMGSMGFALPAAVGACYGAGKRPVVLVAGDGGFQCNIQELQTVRRNNLPIKMVILNNECHGMVRQFQESYFRGRYQSTLWGYSAPAFGDVARAYGIDAAQVSQPDDVAAALQAMWKDPEAPYLLEVKISPLANAYPKLAFGKTINQMEPEFKSLEMEGT